MEGFESLSSAFNIDDKDSKKIIEVQTDITNIEQKRNELEAKIKGPTLYQDQDFIRTELRSLIMSARTVMYKVEQDIKIGAKSSLIEVYSKLLEAIGKQYVSLIELNRGIFEAQVQTGSVDIKNLGQNKISLSSEQLLDMIDKASQNSQMKEIEAKFEIQNEHLPDARFNKRNGDE